MLKAAAEYPERFVSMYEVVEKIDDEKIGEEFKQLLNYLLWQQAERGKVENDSERFSRSNSDSNR